jgi:protein TonB
MRKWIVLSSAAMSITFVLFVFMALLVEKPSRNLLVEPLDLVVEIYNTERHSDISFKIRRLPPPEPVNPPQSATRLNTPPPPELSFDTKVVDNLTAMINVSEDSTQSNLKNPFGQGSVDGDATPVIRIGPQYPVEAAIKGIEGWVKLSFNIDKTGAVVDLTVVESSPPDMFDEPAKRALQQWLYKAKYQNGVAVAQNNIQVQLDFNLED